MKAQVQFQLTFLILAITGLILLPSFGHAESGTAKGIRRTFHEQGFKTDLSDFNFTVPQEMSERAAVLSANGPGSHPISFLNDADLMAPADDHSAVVVWKQQALAHPSGFRDFSYLYDKGADKDVWPLERDLLEKSGPQLDSAVAAVLSGSFGYNLNASAGVAMLLIHLGGLTHLSEMFAGRTMLALHDHDQNAAWTNLLALTRIATGWQIEPCEVSQNVRFGCLQTAYEVTWQALQAGDWPDARLGQLQREWESLDVFKPLPDTVAFIGAAYIALVQREDDPSVLEAEKSLLLFYHDRELEMRRAIQSQSWAQMRLLPDMTNIFFLLPPETSPLPPRTRMQIGFRRYPLQLSSKGISLAGRAAEAETRRRLIITAIALERFHSQHRSYPKSLDALVPDFFKTPLLDFMNGQLLHYSLGRDGHVLLYSVGLDCKDDGGKMSLASEDQFPPPRHPAPHDPDIVWPLPASATLASAHSAEEGARLQRGLAAAQKRVEDAAAQAQATRQAAAKELLHNPKYKKATWTGGQSEGGELIYKNQPLSKLLGNDKSSGARQLPLDELLTLKPVTNSDEPSIVIYQLPISYDRLKNMDSANLSVIIDSPPNEDYDIQPKLESCERATNGDCLLYWNTASERPGLHALQASLTLPTDIDHELNVKGPALPFLSTNLCQFVPQTSLFDNKSAYLYASLVETNATYSVEVKTIAGKHVRTFTGNTTNGVIDLEWDLLDDKGERFTNNSFISYFNITLSRSRRSQTLKQWQNKLGTRGD